jgi:hypothetical protein
VAFNDGQSCGNCAFSAPQSTSANAPLICRVLPPQVTQQGNTMTTTFPVIQSAWWCYGWRPKG